MTLEELHKTSFKNQALLSSATKCGCFYCKRIFTPSEIKEWIDGEKTALCPYCEIDSVIPELEDPVNEELLEKMYQEYFNTVHSDDEEDDS